MIAETPEEAGRSKTLMLGQPIGYLSEEKRLKISFAVEVSG
jgi:hypothetical protein